MDQLLQYIVAQERAGYSQEQIRQALLAQGYNAQQVDGAFKSLGGGEGDSVIHDYVQQYARQGMTPVQAFKTLTEQGFAAAKVRKAITEVYGPGTMPTHHSVAFLLVAVLVAAGLIYFINPFGGEPAGPGPTTPTEISFSESEQLARIVAITRDKGKDEGLKECQLRLVNDKRDQCISNVAIQDNVLDDKLCEQIADVQIRDACLMNFIDSKREAICSRVKLQENVETCRAVALLQQTPAT